MYINVDIDLDDLYSELDKYDKKELAEWLKKDGYFEEVHKEVVAVDTMELGNKLTDSMWRMSNEDIEAIKQILNKY